MHLSLNGQIRFHVVLPSLVLQRDVTPGVAARRLKYITTLHSSPFSCFFFLLLPKKNAFRLGHCPDEKQFKANNPLVKFNILCIAFSHLIIFIKGFTLPFPCSSLKELRQKSQPVQNRIYIDQFKN